MMILCSNACGWGFRELHARYPRRIGWLLGPSLWKNPWAGLQYALDNDAFIAWKNGTPWDEAAWRRMLDKATTTPEPPMWALVPDVVADRQATLENWHRFKPVLQGYGWPLAFAVQDGMTPADVPADAAVIFVGGSTAWKWLSLPVWARTGKRVHVGRVRQARLLHCSDYPIESCDGTGWFREGQTGKPRRFLESFLAGTVSQTPHLPTMSPI